MGAEKARKTRTDLGALPPVDFRAVCYEGRTRDEYDALRCVERMKDDRSGDSGGDRERGEGECR